MPKKITGQWIEFTARPGDMFLVKGKEILIGHYNCVGGVCDDCTEVSDYDQVVWLRNILTKESEPIKKSWTVAAGKVHKGKECRVRDKDSEEWRNGHIFMKKVGKQFQTDDGTFKFAEVLV